MADGSLAQVATHAAPHNLDAEQALLGAILFDNETYNRITPKLQARHFYDPAHGRIFDACAAKIAVGSLADGVTLREQFTRDGGLAEIGGATYLLTLLENAARLTVHAQEYAELVYDLALRRELIRVGGEITDLAENPPDNADASDIIEEAERTLFSLAETGSSSSGLSPFSRALATSIEAAAAAYENKSDVSGLATGFMDLDQKLGGLHKSDLLILAARPSMGKSSLAVNIAYNVAYARLKAQREGFEEARNKGGVVAFFALEMSADQLAMRLLSDFTSIESDRIRRGKIEKHEYEKLAEASVELQALPLHIDDQGGISISALQARCRRMQRTTGLDLIVVDYLQLITASTRASSSGRVQEVSEITMGLKTLAKDLRVPVLALAQLSRAVEQRDDKRPQLSDLRESGSIEQDADVVMFIYREDYYLERQEPREGSEDHYDWQRRMDEARNTADVIIGKQRHGPIGTIKMHFDPRYTRFGNLSDRGQQRS